MSGPTGSAGVCMASRLMAGPAAPLCTQNHDSNSSFYMPLVLFTSPLVLFILNLAIFILTSVSGDFRVATEYKTTLSHLALSV